MASKVKVVVERLVRVKQFVGGSVRAVWAVENKSPFVGASVEECLRKLAFYRAGVIGRVDVAYRATLILPCGATEIV